MKKIATVVCARCGKSKGLYGIRTEKVHNGWEFTWAFRLGESAAKREGYTDTVISSSPETRAGFNGCPYCHSHSMIYCSECHRLNCYNGEERFTCAWCGLSGTVSSSSWAAFRAEVFNVKA